MVTADPNIPGETCPLPDLAVSVYVMILSYRGCIHGVQSLSNELLSSQRVLYISLLDDGCDGSVAMEEYTVILLPSH